NRAGTGLNYLGSAANNPISGALDTSGRLNPQYSNINFRGSDGKSRYNAVIFSLDSSRFRNTGLNFTAKYRYSVTKDDLSSTFSEGTCGNYILGYLDPFTPNLDYGPADFDIHHRFTGSATWQVPFAHNTRGAFRQILDGWEVNVLFVARSGAPFSLYDCT